LVCAGERSAAKDDCANGAHSLFVGDADVMASRILLYRHFRNYRDAHSGAYHAYETTELATFKNYLGMKVSAIASGDGGLAKTVAVAEEKEWFGAELLQGKRTALSEFVVPWKSGEEALAKLPKAPSLKEIKRVDEIRDKKQAVLIIGFPGTTVHDSDRYALELLQEACSDLGSRLFLRIREKLGLAYYVGAQNFLGLAPGYFAFYAGTAPEKVELVEKEILSEAELLRREGLSAEELARAKAKIIGQRKIARQDLGGLATSMALDELYGLGYEHGEKADALYEAVTLAQVKSAAKKYLDPERLVISIVKPGVSAGQA